MISIIIIVKDDRKVEQTLIHLLHFITKPNQIEIIVVDSSNDKLKDIKEKFPEVKWLHHKNISNKITIPHQRNFGIEQSTGDVIVFIDAGCIPIKNWLILLYNAYLQEENIVAGQVNTTDKTVINNISRKYDSTVKYIEECPTANVLISKKVINRIGFFDESFEYGSDTDFMWRALNNGYKIYYERNAIVTHDWGDYKEQLGRSYRYGKGRMKVYLKHQSHLKDIHKKDPILLFYPIYILFLPIIIFYPHYLFLLIIPLIKNWNQKPFQTLLLNFIYGLGAFELFLKYIIYRISIFYKK